MINKKKYKILWVTYIYPPYGGTQGLWAKEYIEHLLKNDNIAIDVITIKPCKYFPQYDYMLKVNKTDRLHEYKIKHGIFHKLLCKANTKKEKSNKLMKISKVIGYISFMEWFIYSSYKIIILKYVKKTSYDGIYLFIDPITTAATAVIAKKIFKSKLVVEYGDPWSIKEPTLDKTIILNKILSRFECKMLEISNKIFVRSPYIKAKYKVKYPKLDINKFKTVYAGMNEIQPYNNIKVNINKINIVFTGLLYKDNVDILTFLKAVKKLNEIGMKIIFNWYGSVTNEKKEFIKELNLDKYVLFHGHKNIDCIKKAQDEADILLLPSFKHQYKIPSKLIQYIGTGRPILVINEINNDPSAELIKKIGCGSACSNNENKIIDTIYNIVNNDKQTNIYDDELRNELTFEYISNYIYKLFVEE